MKHVPNVHKDLEKSGIKEEDVGNTEEFRTKLTSVKDLMV